MKLFDDRRPAHLVRLTILLLPALALAACGGSGHTQELASTPSYGPEMDYPLVVGEPYTIAGTTFTPQDVLNYDEVGYLAVDESGGDDITGSHHTLPLPSYAEVTSLDSGRTILVRLERRGPMNSTDLLALSRGAMAQLEAAPGTAVRLRRVNPPEDQRTLLRMGMPAAPRMDTPMSLVEILRRRLPDAADGSRPGPALAQSTPPPMPAMPATNAMPPMPTTPPAAPVAAAAPPPAGSGPAGALPPLPPLAQAATPRDGGAVAAPARTATAPRQGTFLVQAASFSTADRAQKAARALGGEVSRAGAYFRVRTGPFATRTEAEASLAKVRGAGYSDARILTSG